MQNTRMSATGVRQSYVGGIINGPVGVNDDSQRNDSDTDNDEIEDMVFEDESQREESQMVNNTPAESSFVEQPRKRQRAARAPRAPKSNFNWSYSAKYFLAKTVLRHKGYKTTDTTMVDKWNNIFSDIKANDLFKDADFQAPSVRVYFGRLTEEVLKETGVSRDDVNLSGCSNQPSEMQLLILNMEMEVQTAKRSRAADKKKEKRKQNRLLGHEFSEFETQGNVSLNNPSLAPSVVLVTENAEETSNSGSLVSPSTTLPTSNPPSSGSSLSLKVPVQGPKTTGLTFMQRFEQNVLNTLKSSDESISSASTTTTLVSRLDKIDTVLDRMVDRFERMDDRYLQLMSRLLPPPSATL